MKLRKLFKCGLQAMCACFVCGMMGCASIQTDGHFDPAKFEVEIQHNAGLIENGTSAIVQLALYGLEDDPSKRAQLKANLAVGANAMAAMIAGGRVDADSITTSFKIEEDWAKPAIEGIDTLWRAFYSKSYDNGYVAAASTLATAILKGIQDAGVGGIVLPEGSGKPLSQYPVGVVTCELKTFEWQNTKAMETWPPMDSMVEYEMRLTKGDGQNE